jgi:Tc5 transposase DNA-binding domain/DDE superfamily endonuclease
MGSIEAALAAIESLGLGESINYAKIAKEYRANRSTLSRRHRAKTQPRKVKAINQQRLSPQQEQELIRYIKKLTERGLPPTRQMIQNFAASIARTSVSISWVDQFIKRNSTELISRWTTGIDSNRHKADSEAKYRLYFQLLQQKVSQYNIEPRNTYNMDEKGFLLGITSRSKRIFSRAMYERKEVRQAIQDGSRKWISLLACICADGSSIDPALIYQSNASNLQSSWVEEMNPEHHSVFITSSSSSWTNNKIGLAWLTEVFDCYTKKKA